MVATVLASALVAPRIAGAAPNGVTVRQQDRHVVSRPLRDTPPAKAATAHRAEEPARPMPQQRSTTAADTVVQRGIRPAAAVDVGTSFEGVGQGFSGPQGSFTVSSEPPDPNASVGRSQILEIVNTAIAVLGKDGTVQYGPVPTNTLFTDLGGRCADTNDGDGTARYDALADRWVVTQFANTASDTGPYFECVAVSRTADATGSWSLYSYQYSDFPDYPKIAVWPDAYYITYNMFGAGEGDFLHAEACALDRSAMIAGDDADQQCHDTSSDFGSLLASDVDGTDAPPSGEPNTLLALGTSNTTLAYWHFHVDWSNPADSSFTGPSNLTVAAYTQACAGDDPDNCVPQQGTSTRLASLSDRLMYRLAYRNIGGHESLVVNHSVDVDGTIGVRWYELRLSNGNPTVFQQGTYAPDGSDRWMGSVAMDHAGDIGLGYSVSSSSLHPQIRVTGRQDGDPAGQMTMGEATVIAGDGSQTVDSDGNPHNRWGDYSSMAVDPGDGCTFWYTQEYIPSDGTFTWRTRLASFAMPNCTNGNPPPESTLTYTGPTTSDYHDAFTASATLTAGGSPVPDAALTFSLGNGSGSETCHATTNSAGSGSCSLTPQEAAGQTSLKVVFEGNAAAGPASATVPFTITKEETTLTYSGPKRIANGVSTRFSAVLEEDGEVPIAGRSVTITIGSGAGAQSCTGTTGAGGTAGCSIVPDQDLNDAATVPLSASFDGDAFYRPSSDTATLLLEFMTGRAYGLAADVSAVVVSVRVPPTPDTGSVRTARASSTAPPCTATVSTVVITAHELCAKVVTAVNPGASTATATVQDATIGVPGLPVIGVSGVTATSHTTCDGTTGSVNLSLTIGGRSVTVPTAPNSSIDLGSGAKLVINEQAPVQGADAGLTVTAVHLTALGGAVDVVIASARSDIHNCV